MKDEEPRPFSSEPLEKLLKESRTMGSFSLSLSLLGVLVDWNLFSNDEFCSDPPNMPQFKNLFLSEVRFIFITQSMIS